MAVRGGAAVGSSFAGRPDPIAGVAPVMHAVGTGGVALPTAKDCNSGPPVALVGARVGLFFQAVRLGAANIVFVDAVINDSFIIPGLSGDANTMSAARAGLTSGRIGLSSAALVPSIDWAGLGAQQDDLDGLTVGLGGGGIDSSGVVHEYSFAIPGVGEVQTRLTGVRAGITGAWAPLG